MDQIMEMLGNIDFEAIMKVFQDLFAKIQESGILEKIVEGAKGLISSLSGMIG